MYTNITFGECLKLLLTTLNLKMSQLAKAINVDSSLVNRWVNGKRLPSAAYIGDIVEYLAKNAVTPLQDKLINEIFLHFENNTNDSCNCSREKLLYMLHFALDNSKNGKPVKKEIPENSSGDNAIKKDGADFLQSISLSSNDKLLYGIRSIYSTLVTLLDGAAEYRSRTTDKTIYLTFLNNLDRTFFTEHKLVQFQNKLLEAVSRDWQVTFLFRLDFSIDTIIRFIQFLLPLIKTGKVNLYYLKNSETFSIRKELYVFPAIGALSCFPNDISSGIQSAFCLKNPSAVSILHNYVKLLLKKNAHNLINYYKEDRNESYFRNLAETCERPGEQLYYNSNFTNLLIPAEIYEKLLDKTDLTAYEKSLSLRYYQKQLNGFYKNLKRYISKTIYFTTFLDQLCEDKILYLYTCTGIKIVSTDTRNAIDCLEYVIGIIKEYDNYSIAIVYNSIDDLITDTPLFIKERTAVFLHVYKWDSAEDVRLSINDPVIVKAFTEYFDLLWNKIPLFNKDKQEVILILENRIRILRNELSEQRNDMIS